MLVLASVDNSMQFSFSIELVAAERDEKYSMYCLFQCTASSLLLFFLSSLLPPLLFVDLENIALVFLQFRSKIRSKIKAILGAPVEII